MPEQTSCSSETRALDVNAEFDSPNTYFLPSRVEITVPFASKLLMDPTMQTRLFDVRSGLRRGSATQQSNSDRNYPTLNAPPPAGRCNESYYVPAPLYMP